MNGAAWIGALSGLAVALVTIIGYLLARGRREGEGAAIAKHAVQAVAELDEKVERLDNATHAAIGGVSAKCDLATVAFNDYRVEAAKEFATNKALGETEARTMKAMIEVERRLATAVEGMRADFRSVAERFDKVLMEMVQGEHRR